MPKKKKTGGKKKKGGGGGSNNIVVCVRCRPFNGVEKKMGCKLCISMSGALTKVWNPKSERKDSERKFTFDYAFWSHDKEHGEFWDNPKIYGAVGKDFLDHAWDGFNVSIFAYGQTGSGKSYTMFGWGADKGIIIYMVEELFERIASHKDTDLEKTTFAVDVSMLEIYNEGVSDLLSKSKKKITVREKVKQKKFYCPGLEWKPVQSYDQVDKCMKFGTSNRTVAATQMNATSSRAHTIFQVQITQTKSDLDEKTKQVKRETMRVSLMCLVDLAGSERANKTGATGARLKEGAQINLSLSNLGTCINTLVENQKRKKPKHVPFRNSVLTRLLKHALGGNSKTMLVAALSPADRNFDESLGTLRFADRAKQIVNKAVVNEDAKDKMIREMADEISLLKAQLAAGGITQIQGVDPAEMERMKAEYDLEMQELKKQIGEMEKNKNRRNSNMDQKALMAAAMQGMAEIELDLEEIARKRGKYAHLVCIDEDPAYSGKACFFFEKTETVITGKKDEDDKKGVIYIKGLKIGANHCRFKQTGKKAMQMIPNCDANLLYVNGKMVTKEQTINDGDTIVIGIKTVFRFHFRGKGISDEVNGDEYENALYEIHMNRDITMSAVDEAKISKVQAMWRGGKAREDAVQQMHPDDLVRGGWDAGEKVVGKVAPDTELRVYVKNAVIPDPSRAFVRVQLRRYVCTTDWSPGKTTEPRWDEELRGFKVKSLDDEVKVKILCATRNGAPKMIDKLRIPLWKVDRAGGELRNKFYMDSRTPVNMILTLVAETPAQVDKMRRNSVSGGNKLSEHDPSMAPVAK